VGWTRSSYYDFGFLPTALRHRFGYDASSDFAARRKAWAAAANGLLHADRAAWFLSYAESVRTEEDARAALQALGGDSGLDVHMRQVHEDYLMGRMYRLAGKYSAAEAHLRSAALSAFGFWEPLDAFRAWGELAQLYYGLGDTRAACQAARRVVAWKLTGTKTTGIANDIVSHAHCDHSDHPSKPQENNGDYAP
jgi:hypothetical protein